MPQLNEFHLSGASTAIGEVPLSDPGELESMIKSLTTSSPIIRDAMLFCIDHSESAFEVVDVICKTTTFLSESQLARLYLLSDLLHNAGCSQKGAWIFRLAIQDRLPVIVYGLHCSITKSEVPKPVSQRIRDKVANVISVWRRWMLFSDDFIRGLQFTLDVPRAEPQQANNNEADISREMKLYGLPFLGDGTDYGTLLQFKSSVLGEGGDIAQNSPEMPDEDIDGDEYDSEEEDEPVSIEKVAEPILQNAIQLQWKTPWAVSTPVAAPVSSQPACKSVKNFASLFIDYQPAVQRRRPRTPPRRLRSPSRDRRPRRRRSRSRDRRRQLDDSPIIRRYR